VKKTPLFIFGLVVVAITALGLVILSSASEANALRLFDDPHHFMTRQFMFVAAGMAIAAIVAAFDYRKWRECWFLTAVFYIVVFALLLLVFRYDPVNGSKRWIPFGPVNLQPSEFAKLATVVAVAVWLDRAGWRVELFKKGALVTFAIIGALALPVLREPDFGSVMVIALAGATVMFMAGVRIMHMLPLFAVGFAGVAYKVCTNANRMARIAAFFGVNIDVGGAEVVDAAAKRAAYQSEQAIVALKNGGWTGVGLGESMQKHFYLPEAHTDFIFAVGGEELGLVFTFCVLALFIAFFAIAVYIARKSADRFGRLLAFGMAFLVFFQAIFNLGVVCKALPTKGMALPFFSYGGTNMLSTFFAVGTILSVGIHSLRDRKREILRKAIMK